MHVAFEETQNNIIIEILDDMNEKCLTFES